VQPETVHTSRAAPEPPPEAGQAVAALFREHCLELVRLALMMVGDVATPDDDAGRVRAAHRSWRRLRQPSSGLAYARSSVLNGCRSVHRRTSVARRHAPRLADPAEHHPDAATLLADQGEIVAALRIGVSTVTP
jgi:DNA-directed RNA polymerase specialized sigma24 family protein